MGTTCSKRAEKEDEKNLVAQKPETLSFAPEEDGVDFNSSKPSSDAYSTGSSAVATTAPPTSTATKKSKKHTNGSEDGSEDNFLKKNRKNRSKKYYDDDDDDDDEHNDSDDSDELDYRRRRKKSSNKKSSKYSDDDTEDSENEYRKPEKNKKKNKNDFDEEDEEDQLSRRSKNRKDSKLSIVDNEEDIKPPPKKTQPTIASTSSLSASNPFGNEDLTDQVANVFKKKNAPAPTLNPFEEEEDEPTLVKTSQIKTEDFSSIKSKGSQLLHTATPREGPKRPPFQDNNNSMSSTDFAAEVRSLKNQQLQKASFKQTPQAQKESNPFEESDGEDVEFDGEPPVSGDVPVKPRLTQIGHMKKQIGRVKLAVTFNKERGALEVHILDVEGLSERKFGKPDLYIKLYISPDPKRKTKRKTAIIKHNSSPNFDEKFEFKIPAIDIGSKSLRLALWESGVLSNGVLGEVSIGFKNYATSGDFFFSDYFAISRRSNKSPKEGSSSTAAISGPEDSDDDTKSVRSVRSTLSTGTTGSNNNPFGSDDDARSVMTSGSVNSITPQATSESKKKRKLCNIKLAVGYTANAGVLRVHVQELSELPWEEEFKPDLYVKMFVVPDPKKETKRKTRVINGSLAPKFDELFEWKVPMSDIKSKSLIVSLCEEGTLSNEILAEMSMGFERFDGDFEWNDWFALNRKTSRRLDINKKRASEKIDFANNPSGGDEVIKPQLTNAATNKIAIANVKLDISYEAARGTFKVTVHKIKGLLNYQPMDLYVVLWVHPDEKTTTRSTTVRRKTKTPQFDEDFEFKYAIGEVQSRSLVIQLWEDVGLKDTSKDKLIAQVSIGFKSTEGNNFAWSDWYTLFEKRK